MRTPRRRSCVHSPSGKVPALLVERPRDLGHARHPRVPGRDPSRGCALARVRPKPGPWPARVAAEMHSGFQPLRQVCPMDLLVRTPMSFALEHDVAADVGRIIALWRDCRRIAPPQADHSCLGLSRRPMPCTRPLPRASTPTCPYLAAYGDDGTAQAYVDALFALPAMNRMGGRVRGQKPELDGSQLFPLRHQSSFLTVLKT